MSNIVSALKHEDIRYAGKDLDCDGVSDNQFLRMDALRIVFTGWIIFPPVFIFTLLGNVSLARALIKSLVVYYRSYRFFQYNPASIFLTIRDNTCSSALYSSFHNSNGKYFCAIQNGLRFKTEIGYSYLDHLFAINKDSIRLYQSTGSVINNFNIVPPLSLDKYLKTMSATVVDIDILFIDQGFPVDGIEMWWPNTGKDIFRFFNQVKEFSINHKGLRIVYLMRRYDVSQKYMSDAIENWAKNTSIKLMYPYDSNESYRTVSQSKLVVTMNSTLGIEALSLGVNTLFFNLQNDQDLNVCASPYQHKLRNYQYFENVVNNALYSKVKINKKIIEHYVPPTIDGSKLISNQIKEYRKIC